MRRVKPEKARTDPGPTAKQPRRARLSSLFLTRCTAVPRPPLTPPPPMFVARTAVRALPRIPKRGFAGGLVPGGGGDIPHHMAGARPGGVTPWAGRFVKEPSVTELVSAAAACHRHWRMHRAPRARCPTATLAPSLSDGTHIAAQPRMEGQTGGGTRAGRRRGWWGCHGTRAEEWTGRWRCRRCQGVCMLCLCLGQVHRLSLTASRAHPIHELHLIVVFAVKCHSCGFFWKPCGSSHKLRRRGNCDEMELVESRTRPMDGVSPPNDCRARRTTRCSRGCWAAAHSCSASWRTARASSGFPSRRTCST